MREKATTKQQNNRGLMLAAALLGAVSFSCLAHAQEPVAKAVTQLDPGVQAVASGGYWSNADKEGFYRAVVAAGGVEHVGSALFLQWLQVDPDSNTSRTIATVPVSQINASYSGERVIEIDVDKDAEFGTFHLLVTVRQSRPESETRYELTADGKPGSFSVLKVR